MRNVVDLGDRLYGIVYHANFLRYIERGRNQPSKAHRADHRALLDATENEAAGFAFRCAAR